MTAITADCPRCRSARDPDDLRCPVCALAIPPTEDTGPRENTIRVQVFRCSGCGAGMEYSARVQAPMCAFCGSVVKLDAFADPVEQIETYLPFTVDRGTAIEVYQRWLSQQGFLQPANLASTTRLESLQAVWWAGWAVDADACVTWTLDSDAGKQEAPWRPHAGELRRTFKNVVIPATRGFSTKECVRLILTYSAANGLDPAAAADQADVVRERFETSRSAARSHIIATLQREAEALILSTGVAPGSRFRNVHTAVQLCGLHTRRIAFPAYAIAYRYRGVLHRTVISGQDPTCIIGEPPRSLAKVVALVTLIFAGLAAALVALGLLLR
jgi:hypothetical protein